MTPNEEYRLWKFNHAEWAKLKAPVWAEMLAAASPEKKRELWDWASADLKRELKELASSAPNGNSKAAAA